METEHITFLTLAHGNMLVRLLMAHLLSDFVFQTASMVTNKKWLSGSMLLHIGSVYASTALLTGWWVAAIIISLIHYFIDAIKIEAGKKNMGTELSRFLLEQLFHILSIIAVWMVCLGISSNVMRALYMPFINYRISLILLGYLVVIGPVGYIIKFATQKMLSTQPGNEEAAESTANNINNENERPKNEHGGKLIGIFERIIILTFVLLGQYEAIGFLITGKSIIRFTSNDGDLKSEYVLVGTMMSYSMSILIGVMINRLLIL